MTSVLDPALLVPFGVIGAIIGAIIWFAVAARRRGCVAALTAVGTLSFFGGTIIAAGGALHLISVLPWGGTSGYDFRSYALVQLGVLLIAGGAACVIPARRLMQGEPRAWKTTLWATVALLAINVPLIPIEKEFTSFFSAFAFVNLVALVATHKCFGPSGAHR